MKKAPPKLTVVNKIPTADEEDIRSVIDLLERCLDDAKQGNIKACAVAMVGTGQRVGYISSGSGRHAVKLVASVNLMNWRLCESVWDELDVQLEEIPDPLAPEPA